MVTIRRAKAPRDAGARLAWRCWRWIVACALLLLLYVQYAYWRRIMWPREIPSTAPPIADADDMIPEGAPPRNRPRLRPRPARSRPRRREAVVFTVPFLTKCDAKRLAALVATAGPGRDARPPRAASS